MNARHLFDILPIWLTLLILLAIIFTAVWSGMRFARRRKQRHPEEEAPINTLVGASLALFAFILAFTFGRATDRFDARKAYLLEEVNSIETTWLRADLIAEPHRSEVRRLLVDYVEIRKINRDHLEDIEAVIAASNDIQQQIWGHVNQLVAESPRNDPMNALFINSVNEMFDDQTKRVTVSAVYRIQLMIWITLLILTMFSMFAVGSLFGKVDKPNWNIIVALCLGFAAVILVIIDLDSVQGTIRINQQPINDLYDRISPK